MSAGEIVRCQPEGGGPGLSGAEPQQQTLDLLLTASESPCLQEEVVSYQPKAEDLDYPGKLQRRAAAAAEGAAPPAPPAAGELPNAALDDPEVRVFVISSL